MPFRHFLFQIPVCGNNDSDIHENWLLAANRVELTFLQHSKQFGLNRDRHIANFIVTKAFRYQLG